ncbi:MAG: hypothetical protein J4F36_04375 [Nitrosopumilaceae archaeon]|nr:hypothetical protein [Nitrosopumilaceae archaeon]
MKEETDDVIDLGFEDYKKAMKIFNDEELPTKDPQELHWREQQILAQRMFDDGHTIQAVIILHGLIEIELNRIWIMMLICKSNGDIEKVDLKERHYLDLVEYFEKEKILEEKMIRDLKEFNQLRNRLSHNLYGIKQRTPHKTELKNKFELGLLVSGSLPVLELKYLHDQGKNNAFAKRFFEALQEESEKELEEKYEDKLL